jgi:hypothetical protein
VMTSTVWPPNQAIGMDIDTVDPDAFETVSVAQLQLVVQRIHDLQSELELKDRDLRLSAQLGQTVRPTHCGS